MRGARSYWKECIYLKQKLQSAMLGVCVFSIVAEARKPPTCALSLHMELQGPHLKWGSHCGKPSESGVISTNLFSDVWDTEYLTESSQDGNVAWILFHTGKHNIFSGWFRSHSSHSACVDVFTLKLYYLHSQFLSFRACYSFSWCSSLILNQFLD